MSREESFEDQSFINLVRHYEKELGKILNSCVRRLKGKIAQGI